MSLRRCDCNPLLTRVDIPDLAPSFTDPTSVFNPGAVYFNNRYSLLLRVQSRGRETFLVPAHSDNGTQFNVASEVVTWRGLGKVAEQIYHIYDPRLTGIGDKLYILFAIDMERGCRLGLGVTVDYQHFDFLGIVSDWDSRNGVLFPEQIGGRYLRLERPNKPLEAGCPNSGSVIVLSESEDLLTWRQVGPVMSGRAHFWDELIGSGPPPVKTREGWLHLYHGIATHFMTSNIYQAGVVLLDLNDPTIVKARSRNNILEPREAYEQVGQVPNVVFPSGMIVEEFDDDGYGLPESRVLVYYGAADTVVAVAETTVSQLLAACND
jgi:beta-1,4-mannooligosaccharide/beta-1,4-mannosyl-N-acetylglucosamine phosphorylase